MSKTVGILALQGDFEAHAKILQQLGCSFLFVRTADDLKQIDALIIPGGESTTMLWFLQKEGFFEVLRSFGQAGKPIFGTCAGAILLAKKVINPSQESLGLIDMTIERNGYGRQLDSMVVVGESALTQEPPELVFIRAPRILSVGPNVEVLATYQAEPVMVRENSCFAATFHPELTDNYFWHNCFISTV